MDFSEILNSSLLYDFLKGGGYLMVPLSICFLLTVSVTLERIFYWIKRKLLQDDEGIEAIFAGVKAGKKTESLIEEKSKDCVVKAMNYMLKNKNEKAKVEEYAERLLQPNKRYMGLLKLIATISTSFGLLGTVVGVSRSFNAISMDNANNLSKGLSVALYTTIFGLVIFLTGYILWTLFSHFSVIERKRMSNNLEKLQESLLPYIGGDE